LKVLGRCGVVRFVLRSMVLSRCNERRVGTMEMMKDGRVLVSTYVSVTAESWVEV
jgi:hypothetical protein